MTSEGGYLPIRIEGPLHGGAVSVDGSLSSQFITGLLMALPLANAIRRSPYITSKAAVHRHDAFAARHVRHRCQAQRIPAVLHRRAPAVRPARYNVEGDWSGASCLLVAGATTGEVTVRNLNPVSLQADMAIVDALTRAGARSRRPPTRSRSAAARCTLSNSMPRTAPTSSPRWRRSQPPAKAPRC